MRTRRSGPRLALFAALASVVVVLTIGLAVGPIRSFLDGCGFAARDACLRVLFIGNSYTSVNDLPGMFARLARSAGRHVEVSAIAPGGQTLAGHASSPDVLRAIAGSAWTAVVLQEQSEIPAAADLRDTEMAPAAATLVAAISRANSRPILFETWAHRDGWPERNLDRAAMQAAIRASYLAIGGSLGVAVAPVGSAWELAAADGRIQLWQDDGSHPTAVGTYLAGCVLLRTITAQEVVGLSETGGLTTSDAATLQKAATEAIP